MLASLIRISDQSLVTSTSIRSTSAPPQVRTTCPARQEGGNALIKACSFADYTEEFRYQVNAAIHEMFHALGFSSTLFPSWRDAQGRPYSQGRTSAKCFRMCNHLIGDDSSAVTQTFTERGGSIIKLVTPKALARARAYFACSTLNGVELENQVGAHVQVYKWANIDFLL